MYDTQKIRQYFPALQGKMPDCYLDNAATTQVVKPAIEAMHTASSTLRGNVHRGLHAATHASTQQYEQARTTVQQFIGAKHAEEIIFTKNATESLNLLINSWGKKNLTSTSTVYISYAEHHSAIVPWQQLQQQIGFTLRWIPLTKNGTIDCEALSSQCSKEQPACIAPTGLSNVLGTETDLQTISSIAQSYNALFIVDAAQLIAHKKIDVQELNCDALVFSGHKLYGPTGIGVLYTKKDVLETLAPFLGGGMMIEDVTTDGFTSAQIPQRFEAGTPPITQAIGLAASLEWLTTIDWNAYRQYERQLLTHVQEVLTALPAVTVLPTTNPLGCLSFYHATLHAHDIADILSEQHVHVRAGHHCAKPLHTYLHAPATVRISVGMYTTEQEIEQCLQAITTLCTHA